MPVVTISFVGVEFEPNDDRSTCGGARWNQSPESGYISLLHRHKFA
jgi:hypothetical protein